MQNPLDTFDGKSANLNECQCEFEICYIQDVAPTRTNNQIARRYSVLFSTYGWSFTQSSYVPSLCWTKAIETCLKTVNIDSEPKWCSSASTICSIFLCQKQFYIKPSSVSCLIEDNTSWCWCAYLLLQSKTMLVLNFYCSVCVNVSKNCRPFCLCFFYDCCLFCLWHAIRYTTPALYSNLFLWV